MTSAIPPLFDEVASVVAKILVAALAGYLTATLGLGKKLAGTEARIMAKIDENERASNVRTTKLEHEMWGTHGQDGVRHAVERLSLNTQRNYEAMLRIEGKLDGLVTRHNAE